VREAEFDGGMIRVRALGCPIAKGEPEAMYGGAIGEPRRPKGFHERHVRQLPSSTRRRREDQAGVVSQARGALPDLHAPLAERHAMFGSCLHSGCRKPPLAADEVDLAPHRPARFAAPRRRQNQKAEAQLG